LLGRSSGGSLTWRRRGSDAIAWVAKNWMVESWFEDDAAIRPFEVAPAG
jgi:hypothetical protein